MASRVSIGNLTSSAPYINSPHFRSPLKISNNPSLQNASHKVLMRDKTVLVTGGAGYIGSHTVLQLLLGGFRAVVLDNLENSSEVAIHRVRELAGEFGNNLSFHKVLLLLLLLPVSFNFNFFGAFSRKQSFFSGFIISSI